MLKTQPAFQQDHDAASALRGGAQISPPPTVWRHRPGTTTPSERRPITMSSPDLTEDEIAEVVAVLESRVLSIGPRLDAFERSVAAYVGAAHAVGVNSGTSGLHLAVLAAGIRDGDWAITTPFSFVSSGNCLVYERAVPVFVDVDPRTGNIDPALVAEAVEDIRHDGRRAARWLPPAVRSSPGWYRRARLKAILPVHAFGQPADMDRLLASAGEHELTVIEDACEAIGSEYKGRMAGTFGQTGVFAFYPNKQLTTGEGGIVVTNDGATAALLRSLRNQGRAATSEWLQHERLGYNYRLDELSAAVGLVQIHRIHELLARRRQVAAWYDAALDGMELVDRPFVGPAITYQSWFVYVVRIKSPARRDDVMRRLQADGVPSRPYFPPLHLQPYYREQFGYTRGDFPAAEHLGETCLALPFSGVMTADDVAYVCEKLASCL
jgi:dTDP-4-amino-4,6-dideoxygalactose transaminase